MSQGPELDPETAEREEQFGTLKGAPGTWASCVRVVDASDPAEPTTSDVFELGSNEAATCMALVTFNSAPEEGPLLVVGTAHGLSFYPRQSDGAQRLLFVFSVALSYVQGLQGLLYSVQWKSSCVFGC